MADTLGGVLTARKAASLGNQLDMYVAFLDDVGCTHGISSNDDHIHSSTCAIPAIPNPCNGALTSDRREGNTATLRTRSTRLRREFLSKPSKFGTCRNLFTPTYPWTHILAPS